MKKIIVLAAVVAMLAAFAGPASASPTGVGAYQGNADVSTTPSSDCGIGDAGEGLGLPALGNTTGTWGLSTSTLVLATDVFAGQAVLGVCGQLGPVAGIGAACGISNGHSGSGDVKDENGNVLATLTAVEWKTSAGGTLPVTGTVNGAGTLVSVAQAQGAAPCLSGTATSFAVAGVAAFV